MLDCRHSALLQLHVIATGHVNPLLFLELTRPPLCARDLQGLSSLVRHNWRIDQLLELLSGEDDDARKVAALSLSLVGGSQCVRPLTRLLRQEDAMAAEIAEHALWCIWFRASTSLANQELARGTEAMNRGQYDHALAHLDDALQLDETFAEAWHQRGILHYLTEDFARCAQDCRKAIALMENHFGAWQQLGHAQVQLDQLPLALSSYRRALAIHPHLDAVRRAVAALETCAEQSAASD